MNNYLLPAMIAILLITSCSDDKVVNSPEYSNKAIEFTTVMDKAESRVPVTTPQNITGFTVTAWWKEGGQYLFNATDITRGEDIERWKCTPTRYWPTIGDVDFYAYSPASSISMISGLLQNPHQPLLNFPRIHYKVPALTTDVPQEDLLVAVSMYNNNHRDGTVRLNFQHALSRVLFNAKKPNDNVTYTIYGIELINIYDQAILELRPSMANVPSDGIPQSGTFKYGNQNNNPLILWTNHGIGNGHFKTSSAVDMSESPVYVLSDEYTPVIGESNALMVMPQQTVLGSIRWPGDSLEEIYTPQNPNYMEDHEFYIKVSYRAFQGEEPNRIYYAGSSSKNKDIFFPVKDPDRTNTDTPFSFEIGRQYTFNITFGHEISEKPIGFEILVNDWTMPNPIPDPNP